MFNRKRIQRLEERVASLEQRFDDLARYVVRTGGDVQLLVEDPGRTVITPPHRKVVSKKK
jgi:t-SNARE complex subunit (syntaxin)